MWVVHDGCFFDLDVKNKKHEYKYNNGKCRAHPANLGKCRLEISSVYFVAETRDMEVVPWIAAGAIIVSGEGVKDETRWH